MKERALRELEQDIREALSFEGFPKNDSFEERFERAAASRLVRLSYEIPKLPIEVRP